ncbi:hypothetical protein K438DRAFT_1968508 [Mycena galopus ATCC 62051]|nr:hypothetical protein K438DRAFT_1968508 [Mycena galopus ATCC 62051]
MRVPTSQRHPDLVFEHPAQLQIHISSGVPDSKYLQACRPGETDHKPSRRLSLFFCIAARVNSGCVSPFPILLLALPTLPTWARSPFCSFVHEMYRVPAAHVSLLQMLDTPRAYDLTLDAVPRPRPQHQAPVHPRYETQQALWFFNVCAALVNPRACVPHGWDVQHQRRARRLLHPSPSHTPFSLPPTCDEYLRQCPSLPRLPFSCSSKYHPSAPPPACAALAGWFTAGSAMFFCPRTTTIDVSPLRLPALPSTQEYPHTPDARCHWHAQRLMPSASQPPPKGHCRALATSLRSAATCRSAVQHLRRPFLHVHATPNPLHAARDVLRHWDVTSCAPPIPAHANTLARHHASAHPSPNPHRQPHGQRLMLASVFPDAAFVASSCSATVLTGVSPTPVPPTLLSTTHNTSRICTARPSRSSSPSPHSSPSHTPPPSTLLTTRRARLNATPTRHRA